MNAFDIYANHFRDRSSQAVNLRASWAANLARIQDQQARDGVRPGEIDIAKSVAGEAGAPPLRTVYDKTRKVVKANRREANSDDGPTQRPYTSKRASFLKKEWTAEEDALLRQLVERNIGLPEQTLWTKVSGGNVAGSFLLRAPVACSRRWMHLHPSQESRDGHWTKAEDLRLQKAISKQLEGKYQVIVDVLLGQPTATENRLKDWCPHLQQLQGQEGLPILKLGSKQLKMLSWIQIAEEVKSRNDQASIIFSMPITACWITVDPSTAFTLLHYANAFHLLENLKGADLSTTVERDHSSPKHANTNGDPPEISRSPAPNQIILRTKTDRPKTPWWTIKKTVCYINGSRKRIFSGDGDQNCCNTQDNGKLAVEDTELGRDRIEDQVKDRSCLWRPL
ncbi:hypothetical protein BGZ97_011307 [Linnemannia gamsii]|uniref:Myb-like domain-containing protein n=1 Tax=Linnemannia gamsii TaxID=64522 RepID=A0A9P6R4F6_9FUNG|nr:hypothetical protein BGZ97_011307 [Linnemannia gamsii]